MKGGKQKADAVRDGQVKIACTSISCHNQILRSFSGKQKPFMPVSMLH